jgi:hypothetical protein
MRPASIIAFAVAFLALSVVADKSAMFVGLSLVSRDGPRTVTGTVMQWQAGESIAVGSGQNPAGFPLALRPDTVYEGDVSTIRLGARVTVWYRNVSERRLVVEKVRVLDRDDVDVDFTAVLTLDPAGQCRFVVGEALYAEWEIRRMALELLFFDESDAPE